MMLMKKKKNVLTSVSTKNIALIHSCNKHLVSAYYVPDIVLVSSVRKVLELMDFKF